MITIFRCYNASVDHLFSPLAYNSSTTHSGFEHVFLGEIDDGKVKGVHNWIWLYQMEKKQLIDYQVNN